MDKAKKKKRKMSATKKKGLFMKIIIVYCLAFIAITNIWALFILQDTGSDAYNIINAINIVHGGELLLCCVKKVIDSPDNDIGRRRNRKRKEDDTEYDQLENSDYISSSEIIDGVEYSSEDCRGEEDV